VGLVLAGLALVGLVLVELALVVPAPVAPLAALAHSPSPAALGMRARQTPAQPAWQTVY